MESLNVQVEDGFATIDLCRPAVQNRFDHVLHDELDDTIGQLAAKADVRAVLLTAQGSVFSGGGDTERVREANAESPHDKLVDVDRGRELFRRIADLPKPLVIALTGDVFGVATSLVLLADAVVSYPGVRIADPHVRLGLVAGDGGVVVWPMNLATTLAKRHLLWGEPLLAEDAHRLGVVTDLEADADAVRARAVELAGRVAALPPVAVQLTKRALNQGVASRINEVFDLGFYLEAMSLGTDDVLEAIQAFHERRAGKWSGR